MSLVSGLLNQTMDVYSTTKDKHNTVIKSIVYADVSCRWESKTTTLTGKDSQEKTSTVTAWILPSYTILDSYEVVKDGETYEIVGIRPEYDLGGIKDHIMVFLV